MLHVALCVFEYRNSESLSNLMSTLDVFIYFPFGKIRWTVSGITTGLCFLKVGEGKTYF